MEKTFVVKLWMEDDCISASEVQHSLSRKFLGHSVSVMDVCPPDNILPKKNSIDRAIDQQILEKAERGIKLLRHKKELERTLSNRAFDNALTQIKNILDILIEKETT